MLKIFFGKYLKLELSIEMMQCSKYSIWGKGLRSWTHKSYYFKSVFVYYHNTLYLSLHRITNL